MTIAYSGLARGHVDVEKPLHANHLNGFAGDRQTTPSQLRRDPLGA